MSGWVDLISFSMAVSCACVSLSCVWASSSVDMAFSDDTVIDAVGC